jgi:hypothetical protein
VTKPTRPQASHSGPALVVVSAILFSGKAILVKLAYPYGIDAISLLALRMAFSLPIFVVMSIAYERAWRREHHQKSTPLRDRATVAALGCIGYYLASYFCHRDSNDSTRRWNATHRAEPSGHRKHGRSGVDHRSCARLSR